MTEPGKILIRLRGAAFGYGPRNVLTDVDLEIRVGDFMGILGPNGAGKTTLFRGILGLLKPHEGTVELYRCDATRGASGQSATTGRRARMNRKCDR